MRKSNSDLFSVWRIVCCVTFLAWIGSGHSLAQARNPILLCRLSAASAAAGEQVGLFIEVRNVQDLYGFELRFRYSPDLVKFVDTDPAGDLEYIELGDFLSPGFLMFDDIDKPGEFWLNASQTDPTPARSGTGVLARAMLTGRQIGKSDFTLADVILYDVHGNDIERQVQNCTIEFTKAPPAGATETRSSATVCKSQQQNRCQRLYRLTRRLI